MTDTKIPPFPSPPQPHKAVVPERPMPAPRTAREEGTTIRFDWYPQSVGQVVTLHRGKPVLVESIVGRVSTPSSAPGPTSLTLRRVPSGHELTTGKALHTGSIDLVGPVNTDITGIEQIMAMAPKADRTLVEGDVIAAAFEGPMKDARGVVTIKLSPVKE